MLSPIFSPVELPRGVTFFERGWLSSNNVVLWDSDEVVWIDTGYVAHATQTLELHQKHWPGRAIDQIINTHLHSDHCGGNHYLQSVFPNAVTKVPAGQFCAVREWDEDELTFVGTSQRCDRFVAQGFVTAGEELELAGRVWKAIAAPGHDPDALMLWQPEARLLISADAMWSNGFGIVFPELQGKPGFDHVGQTLDAIERLQPLLVLPGHGGVIRDVPLALKNARSKLAMFRANPARHTHHALKALIKFLVMDLQRIDWPTLLQRIQAAPLLANALAHGLACEWSTVSAQSERAWHTQDLSSAWLATALDELVEAGALQIDGNVILDA